MLLEFEMKPINQVENQVKYIENEECYDIKHVTWFHVRHENLIYIFVSSPIAGKNFVASFNCTDCPVRPVQN